MTPSCWTINLRKSNKKRSEIFRQLSIRLCRKNSALADFYALLVALSITTAFEYQFGPWELPKFKFPPSLCNEREDTVRILMKFFIVG